MKEKKEKRVTGEIIERDKKTGKKNYIDMTQGPILKKMILFALPIILSNTLQLTFNAADIIVVGRFGEENSLAAVGATSALLTLFINMFVGLSVGSNVLAARYIGAKEYSKLQAVVHTSMAIALAGGVVTTILGILLANPLLVLLDTPDEVLGKACTYVRIYFIGLTGSMIYNFGNSILRAKGDTKRPLIYLTISGIVNVILNLVFVIMFRLDVAGVAMATTISNYLSAILMIICLMKENENFRLRLRKIRFDMPTLKGICRIGVPSGFSGCLFSISNMFIQASINSFGSIVMAGSAAASNIENFVYFAMNAFYQASVSFTGQNHGAGKIERVKPILWCSLGCVTVTGLVLGLSAYFAGSTLVGIYNTNPDIIYEGVRRMAYLCAPYALDGIMNVLAGVMRGLGYSITPMIITLIGTCALRITWIMLVLHTPALYSIDHVYWSYPATWIVTSAVEAVYLKKIYRKLANNQ